MINSVSSAIEIICGKWVPIEEVEIPITETPEDDLMHKEWFDALSKEGKIVVNLILSAPKEMFFTNGRINRQEFFKYVRRNRRRPAWSRVKIDSVLDEIGTILKAVGV
jgi:hypothetical protein